MPRPRAPRDDGEVVLVMGIPGAGKSSIAEEYVARGYSRLNRDELGGSLRQVAAALESALASGVRRVVLDNTYLTRASRSYVVEAAGRHRLPARCVWLDTPLAQAQVNLVERLLDRLGASRLPRSCAASRRREPGLLSPTSQMRALRELEPPAADEGLAGIERVPFARRERPGAVGVFVAAAALERPGWRELIERVCRAAPRVRLASRRAVESLDGPVAQLAAHVSGPVESALCPHPAGPPTCWCRPPLPGLLLAFARAQSIDPARSTLIGTGPAHRQLAAALGSTYLGANRA